MVSLASKTDPFARPILPPGRQTQKFAHNLFLIRCKHDAKGGEHGVERRFWE